MFMNEYDKSERLIMTVHPATAGNVNEQYVCVKLHVIITPNVSFKATLECDVLDINCRSDLPTQEEEP